MWTSKIRLSNIVNTITADVSANHVIDLVLPSFRRIINRSQGLILECDTAMICAKCQADLTNGMNLMDKLEFAIIEFNLGSGKTYYLATPPISIYIRRSTVIYEQAHLRHNSLLWHYKWIQPDANTSYPSPWWESDSGQYFLQRQASIGLTISWRLWVCSSSS